MDFVRLLETRRGIPVPISSLPILYYDKYGKVFQVDGYLTEPHKIGSIACGLTELIAPMTSCIRVIDRPQGKQSIILEDDIPRYMKFVQGRNEHGSSLASACQVYLTFPQCTFSERDLQTYFSTFLPVQEVKIRGQGSFTQRQLLWF